MARLSPGRLVLIGRLLVLVFAAKRRCLSGGGPLQLLDPLLKSRDQWLQFFELLNTLAQRLIFGFELLDAKVARISIHAHHR